MSDEASSGSDPQSGSGAKSGANPTPDGRPVKPRSLLARAGVGDDKAYRSVSPPIYPSATFLWDDPDTKPPIDYARSSSPNRALLEETLAALEGGASAVAAASGMAAIDLVLNLVRGDELVVAPHDCYGGTHRLLSARARQGHCRVRFIDQNDEAGFAAALAERPRLVFFETPSNPLMRLVDLAAWSARAKAAGALTCADNTFLTPLRQQVLALGCDLAVHSTTKFINGHSDVIGGMVAAREAGLGEELAWWAKAAGPTASPHDCAQVLRGLRTLPLRLDAQEASARLLAARLEQASEVSEVFYTGLSSHPQRELAERQQSGPGSLISFRLRGGPAAAAQFLRALEVFNVGPSLGGFESLACLPETMTHAGMEEAARRAAGVTADLVRLSVGIEDADDLAADLERALAATHDR